MRYISIFSGIEAATVAAESLGWEPVAFSEIDAFPSAVLAHHYPEVPNLGDITKIDWRKYRGKAGLVIGGSPCQSFSIAGKREGLKGESGLMFEYIRCVREVRPTWFVWENVPGAFSSERGEAFRQFVSEMDKLGYGLAWRVLDAQFYGVPQRRRRVFVVGRFRAEPPTEVLFDPESLRGDLAPSREKREELTARVEERVGGRGAGHVHVMTTANTSANGSNFTRDITYTLDCTNSNAICMKDATANAYVGDTPSLLAHAEKEPPIVCVADDNAKAAIDTDMCGSLKVGGGVSRG